MPRPSPVQHWLSMLLHVPCVGPQFTLMLLGCAISRSQGSQAAREGPRSFSLASFLAFLQTPRGHPAVPLVASHATAGFLHLRRLPEPSASAPPRPPLPTPTLTPAPGPTTQAHAPARPAEHEGKHSRRWSLPRPGPAHSSFLGGHPCGQSCTRKLMRAVLGDRKAFLMLRPCRSLTPSSLWRTSSWTLSWSPATPWGTGILPQALLLI